MIKNYKSPANRLAHYFEASRDKWKKRALSYRENIRKLKVKVRDLSESRKKWKKEAKELKAKVDELQKKQKKTKDLLRHLKKL